MEAAKSAPQKAIQKVCTLCGKDVSQVKRTKDAQGRYLCEPCLGTAKARSPVQGPAIAPVAPPVVPQQPIPPPTTTQPKRSVGWMVVGALLMLIVLGLLAVLFGIKDDPTVGQGPMGVTTVMLVIINVLSVMAFAASNPKTAAAIAEMVPKSLGEKVFKLGDLTVLTYGQIAGTLGPSSSINRMAGTKFYAVWSDRTYRIGLLFEGQAESARCLGIQSEQRLGMR